MDDFQRLIAISTGTLTAEIITLPICTLKANYQNNNCSTNIGNVARLIWHNHGIRGFYNSTVAACGSQILSTGSKYVLYRKYNNYINNTVVSGLLSGLTSSAITHPVDVVKLHSQTQKNFGVEFRKIGYKIFYRGYSKTLMKYSIGSMCFFPIRDNLLLYTNNLLASFGTAIISTVIIHPFDYMKTRQACGEKIFHSLNPIKYYKGLSLNLFRIVPHFTIMMTVTGYLEKFFSTNL